MLGMFMGGAQAAVGQGREQVARRYNLARYGEDADSIASYFAPEEIENRLIDEEQRIAKYGWLFNKSKDGKGNFLNRQGIRKIATAYNKIKNLNPETFEGINEEEFFQTLNDAEQISDILSQDKFSDISEEGAQNAFIQSMRLRDAGRVERGRLAESELLF